MNFHNSNDEGPPCTNMEKHLHSTADGTANWLVRWFTLAHSARCAHCGTFLKRLQDTLNRLRSAKADPPAEALERLAKGAWREAGK
jgi:hypothetical protein